MNKQEMVNRLVSYCQSQSEEPATASLQTVCGKNFTAFAKMSERRLRRELEFRGLLAFDEPEEKDEEDHETSGIPLMALLSRSTGGNLGNHFFD